MRDPVFTGNRIRVECFRSCTRRLRGSPLSGQSVRHVGEARNTRQLTERRTAVTSKTSTVDGATENDGGLAGLERLPNGCWHITGIRQAATMRNNFSIAPDSEVIVILSSMPPIPVTGGSLGKLFRTSSADDATEYRLLRHVTDIAADVVVVVVFVISQRAST